MRLYDLQVEPDGYSFRLASGEAAGALARLHQIVAAPDLRWDAERQRWLLTAGYEVTLSRFFDSFAHDLARALSEPLAVSR